MMQMRYFLILILITPTLAMAQSELVTGAATPREVYEKVAEAALFLSTTGEGGLKEFQNPTGRFVWKNTHKFYILELCNEAMYEPQGAWIEYWHPRPGFKKSQRKVGFMMPASNTPYQVVSGIYNDTATLEELNKISNR